MMTSCMDGHVYLWHRLHEGAVQLYGERILHPYLKMLHAHAKVYQP